jgi:hypothetical protein
VNQSICVASYEQGHRSGEVHFRTKVEEIQDRPFLRAWGWRWLREGRNGMSKCQHGLGVGKRQTLESLAKQPKRDLDAKMSELRGEER